MSLEISWDNTAFQQQPQNGLKPLCAFCSGEIDLSVVDNSWFWFVYHTSLHAAHSECMQQNVGGDASDDLQRWLINIGGPRK
jgi:hypothetical protein